MNTLNKLFKKSLLNSLHSKYIVNGLNSKSTLGYFQNSKFFARKFTFNNLDIPQDDNTLNSPLNKTPKIEITNDFENIAFPNNYKTPKNEIKVDNRSRNFRSMDGDEFNEINKDNKDFKGKFKNFEKREGGFDKKESFSNFNDFNMEDKKEGFKNDRKREFDKFSDKNPRIREDRGFKRDRNDDFGEDRSFNRDRGFRREGEDRGFNKERSFNRDGEDRGFNRDRGFRRDGEDRGFNRDRSFRRDGEDRGFNKERSFNKDGEDKGFNRDRSFRRDGEDRGFNRDRSFRRDGEDRGDRNFKRDGEDRGFNRDRSFRRDGEDKGFNRDRSFGRDGEDRGFNRDRNFKREGEERGFNKERSFKRDGEERVFNRDNLNKKELDTNDAFRGIKNDFFKKDDKKEVSEGTNYKKNKNDEDENKFDKLKKVNKNESNTNKNGLFDTIIDQSEQVNETINFEETEINIYNEEEKETVQLNRLTISDLKKFKTNEKKESNSKIELNNTINENTEDIENPDMKDQRNVYLYGYHVIDAVLNHNYRKCLDLFVNMNYKDNTPDHIQRLINLASSKNVKIKYLTKEKLDRFTSNRPHNGIILKSEPRDYVYISQFDSFSERYISKKKGNLILILDQIIDPQNLGSIIRSSFFLGVDRVMLNKKNKPSLSSAVSKVSSGASECQELFAIKNIKNFVSSARQKGWIVVSTNLEKETDIEMKINVNEVDNKESNDEKEIETNFPNAQQISITELNLDNENNVILILGSEGFGVTSDLNNVATYNVFIPPMLNKEMVNKPPFNLIDSLNVGVSAGILINHIKSQLK